MEKAILLVAGITYLALFSIGFTTSKKRILHTVISSIGLAVISVVLFLSYAFLGAAAQTGAALAVGAIMVIASAIILPIVGYFSGLLSATVFKKRAKTGKQSILWSFIGILIIFWPIPLGTIIGIVSFPKIISHQKKKTKKRLEREQRRLESEKIELELYKQTQKNKTYAVQLSGQTLYLRPFKNLRFIEHADTKTPRVRRGSFWGTSINQYFHTPKQPNDISSLRFLNIHTHHTPPECQDTTDVETAAIWCRNSNILSRAAYSRSEYGMRNYNRSIQGKDKNFQLEFHPQPNKSESAPDKTYQIITPGLGNTWKLYKPESLDNIYGELYVRCMHLPTKPIKNRGHCEIGFLITDDVFINISIRTSKVSLEKDSIEAINLVWRYWKILKTP